MTLLSKLNGAVPDTGDSVFFCRGDKLRRVMYDTHRPDKAYNGWDRCESGVVHVRRSATSPVKGVVRMRRRSVVKAIFSVALALYLMYILAIKVY